VTRLVISSLPLGNLKLIERQALADSRGFLARLFCSEELEVAGWDGSIAQINHTLTYHIGSVSGMDY
jgi:dTDP-4-dehydrorhamnose 3,5-epimerase